MRKTTVILRIIGAVAVVSGVNLASAWTSANLSRTGRELTQIIIRNSAKLSLEEEAEFEKVFYDREKALRLNSNARIIQVSTTLLAIGWLSLFMVKRNEAALKLQSDKEVIEKMVEVRTSELREANKAIASLLEQEQQLNEMKSRFTAMVSHDIRSPLSAIELASKLLRRKTNASPEEKERWFDQIDESIQRIIKLLENVLAMERSQLSLELKRVDLWEIVASVGETLGAVNRRRVRFAAEQTATILGDEQLLRRAVENLISNALKYSAEDVEVCLRVGHAISILEIKDTGIGISDEDAERVFVEFYRGSNATSLPGTGLGLALVREVIELHGGEINLQSKIGAGSTFTVVLPNG